MQGWVLGELTWLEAERLLTPERVLVLPIGAGAKEHGPHLRLGNDLTMARYLTRRVLERAAVVALPELTYCYYPAFAEYPGSTSIGLETARDTLADICRGLARFGPRRFYALNTGISTLRALAGAAERLAASGLLLRYTELGKLLGAVEREVGRQEGGTHADEIETSMMLCIAPETVDMTRAVKDYDGSGKGPLTRARGSHGTYSPTGTWGDPTLATVEKGLRLVEAAVEGLLAEISELQRAQL